MLVGSSWLLEKISGFFLILNSLFRSIATQAPTSETQGKMKIANLL
jgi:hypothetical protein